MPRHFAERIDGWTAKRAMSQAVLERYLERLEKPDHEIPSDIQSVAEIIDNRLFDSELNVTAVRRWCGITNNNFSARFRAAMGVGLREYIEGRRIRAAEYLLKETDLEVYWIAMAVGYSHCETFYRAFQRHRSLCTPQQFRERSETDSGVGTTDQPSMAERRP